MQLQLNETAGLNKKQVLAVHALGSAGPMDMDGDRGFVVVSTLNQTYMSLYINIYLHIHIYLSIYLHGSKLSGLSPYVDRSSI